MITTALLLILNLKAVDIPLYEDAQSTAPIILEYQPENKMKGGHDGRLPRMDERKVD